MERLWAGLVALAACASCAPSAEFRSDTPINNVVLDERSGRLYVGAVNALYQLSPDLDLQSRVDTGPRRDHRLCTPPVTAACQEAADTDNHNKLLLVHGGAGLLVECGSVFRGICSLRNLSAVRQLVYFSDSKGEKSYVASAEDDVSVVGVMSHFTKDRDNLTVFLVGKGYGSHDSTKLISTRILRDYGDWVVFDSIIEASAVQANPFVLRYLHDFRFAFRDGGFVYFLFSRTLGVQDNKNFTFVSRMCEDDHGYFSYTELQLNCSAGNRFNKARAAYVAAPGEVLAQNLTDSGLYGTVSPSDQVLFVTFSSDEEPSSSALCLYPLRSINQRLLLVISSCYSHGGFVQGRPAVYSPYSSKAEELCSSSNQDMAQRFRCGAEFLPSPLASKAEFALRAEPALVRKGHMTAVAVAVEEGHAVAFLGTAGGQVLKVHLSAHPEVFGRTPGDVPGDTVNKNLLLDASRQHLYVTTRKKVTRVPVQTCRLQTDCRSCVGLKDPYCGWCVLEGRCSRKQDCSRSEEDNTWLWSPRQQCVEIEAFDPPNLSSRRTQQVQISVPALPRLRPSDRLQCVFDSLPSDAVVLPDGPRVACSLPDPSQIPPPPRQQDSVSVRVKLLLNSRIEVTRGQYHFYSCAAAARRNHNTPCVSCVSSSWGCQWNTELHSCSDEDGSVSGEHVIRPQQPEDCPQFESPEPLLVPVGLQTPISFQGRNLDFYKGRRFSMGTELMGLTEEEVEQEEQEEQPGSRSRSRSRFRFRGYKFSYDRQQEVNVSFHIRDRDSDRRIDSSLTVLLYNCSVLRGDCSLCKAAPPRFGCVWCPARRSCVFRQLCPSSEPARCPDPHISDVVPRFGPLSGRISVTIRGSNMGVRPEDVRRIRVAGVDCVHQEDRFSVSTSLVCEIGPARRAPPSDLPVEPSLSGPVELELDGGGRGTSQVLFTYRDPRPSGVRPSRGPAAGGTVLTVSGEHLDTAGRADVAVSVGGVPCEVLSFGPEITCRTGRYRGQKVPSDPLTVTVRYGRNTSRDAAAPYQYAENPKISDYAPRDSFLCGGRRILVLGTGFDLVQTATMKVRASSDEFSLDSTQVEFTQPALSKNDTVLQFESPAVNGTDSLSLRTSVQLDALQEELPSFRYHPDPAFNRLGPAPITGTSVVIVTGRGFSRAMTAKEAQAFVGDASCPVNILQDDKLILEAPSSPPRSRSRRQRRDTTADELDLVVKFGRGEWTVGSVYYARRDDVPLAAVVPAVVVPMLLFIAVSVYCYRRKSRQAEREYEKVKQQLDSLEDSVRDRCKKEFTDLMIEMEDQTSDPGEVRIPFLDYKTYTERNFFLPSENRAGAEEPVISGRIQIPAARRATVAQALTQFSNLLNSKTFLIHFIRTLEARPDFNARCRGSLASLLTVALHGKLEYFTDVMRTLLLQLMDQHVLNKNPKLMLRRSETVVERMLCNWMSICLYQFLRDTAGEPMYKLFKALKHQVEKGPVDARLRRAKYTLTDTGLLGGDVDYRVLTLQVLVHGEGPDVTPVKVLNCDTITQVKEKIIDQVYRNLPFSQRPKVESVALEWRPGSTGQILSDLDLTSQRDGRWTRLNTLAHYNVRDNATLVLSRVLHTQSVLQNQDSHEEKNVLLEDDCTFHLVRPADELDEVKSKRGSVKDKSMTKAITEIYLTRLLSVKGTLQQFVDDFFRSVLCSGSVPPAVKYFFDFLDEQAQRHDNVDEETLHIWKTNSLPLRFWVNILRNPHFILDVHVTEVVDASLHVIAQTFMDACTKTEHKLSRDSPSNKLLYAKEIPTYKKMVDDYYRGIRQMVPVSDQDMNTHLAEVSRQHTDQLNTQAALHQLYQYASKYYDAIIQSLDEDPAAQNKQLTLRLQQVAAALENKVTDL